MQAVAGDVIKATGPTSHPLRPAGAFLHVAELLEELAPADDAFFAALEAVGTVECGGVRGCCVAARGSQLGVVLQWVRNRQSKKENTYGLGEICR
jgi:hypothetical protein